MEPSSLTGADTSQDRRLSTLIDEARLAGTFASSIKERERAHADRVFSDISAAVERGLRTLDPRSPEAGVLERLRDGLKCADER